MSGWLKQLLNPKTAWKVKEELESTIKWIKPHIMVIGSDWKDGKVIGKKWAEKLIFFDRIGDYSTTKILERKWVK